MSLLKTSALVTAADSYCTYVTGLSIAVNGPAAAEAYFGHEVSRDRAALEATQVMYESARRIAEVGAATRYDKSLNVLAHGPAGEVDEELASFAVEAIDIAFEQYENRIRRLGVFTLPQEVMRPCILKQSEGVYLVRRSRTDRLSVTRFAGDMLHDAFEPLGSVMLCDLRARVNAAN